LSVRSTTTGVPSHDALVAAILTAQASNPLAAVTVVAPTSRAAIHLPRLVAASVTERTGRGGVANVNFVVIRRLCDEIGGSALRARGRRPLSRIALESACRSALGAHRAAGGTLGRSAPAVSELADRYDELRAGESVSIELLSRRGGLAAELASLVARVREILVPTHYDDVDLYEETARLASRRTVPTGPVIVFAPEQMTPAIRRVYDAMATTIEVTLLLAETGDDVADAPFNESAREALVAPPLGDRFSAIFHATDAPAEVRHAARVVRKRITAGVAPEEVAVVYPRRSPYAELLAYELDRADIPWSGPSPGSLALSLGAQLLSCLLAICGDEIERVALVRVVSATASRPGERAESSPGTFDRITRRVGLIAAPLPEWLDRLSSDFAAPVESDGHGDERGSDQRVDPEFTSRSWRQRRDAVEAGVFRQTLHAIARHATSLASSRTWLEASGALRAALADLLAPEEVRCSWPDRLGEAERLLLSVLEELAELDAVEHFDGLAALGGALEAACERDGPQAGRLGSGVIVGTLEHSHGLALDTVIVLGCAEGDLPARAPASPLLSVTDREAVGLDPRTIAASTIRDRRRLLLSLGGALDAVAFAPGSDARSGRERVRSRFLDGGPRPIELDRIPLEGVGATELEVPTDLLLDALVRAGRGGDLDPGLAALVPGLDASRARLGSRGTYPCGPFDGAAPGAIVFEAIAPTTIEAVAICPFRFFATHLLGIESVEEPERRWSISPSDRGLAVHAILEQYVRRRIDGTLPAADDARASELATIASSVFSTFERFGRTGKPILWEIERRRILVNLERERQRDEVALSMTGAVSIAVEHRFGTTDLPGPSVTVRGRSIEFRGTIDRVDRHEDGTLEVIDYKSGTARRYRNRGDQPVGRGRQLQLPVYALAARARFGEGAVRATYRFIGEQYEEVEFGLDEDGTARFEHSLDVLVGAIDSGRYPYRPRDGLDEHCRGCEYDALCPTDRAERWERERQSEDAAAYVALVEPEPATEERTSDHS
jgi:RecB family exonuclease